MNKKYRAFDTSYLDAAIKNKLSFPYDHASELIVHTHVISEMILIAIKNAHDFIGAEKFDEYYNILMRSLKFFVNHNFNSFDVTVHTLINGTLDLKKNKLLEIMYSYLALPGKNREMKLQEMMKMPLFLELNKFGLMSKTKYKIDPLQINIDKKAFNNKIEECLFTKGVPVGLISEDGLLPMLRSRESFSQLQLQVPKCLNIYDDENNQVFLRLNKRKDLFAIQSDYPLLYAIAVIAASVAFYDYSKCKKQPKSNNGVNVKFDRSYFSDLRIAVFSLPFVDKFITCDKGLVHNLRSLFPEHAEKVEYVKQTS